MYKQHTGMEDYYRWPNRFKDIMVTSMHFSISVEDQKMIDDMKS